MNAIIAAISNVMAQVGSVKKDGTNSFHNYKYATAADVLHKLQPLLAKEGLVIFQTEKTRDFLEGGAILAVTYEFTIAHKGGDLWPEKIIRTGMAPARNAKGGFDDKALNKCHTAAHKYFHITLFEIPTGDYDDADADEDRPAKTINAAPRKDAPTLQPPVHPETGETSPHSIPYDGNPVGWGGLYIAAIKTAQTADELNAWRQYNDDTLIEIQQKAPKAHASIVKATLAQAQKFGQLEAAE